MNQELIAIWKAKSLALDCLETSQPWGAIEDAVNGDAVEGCHVVTIKDPAQFAHRISVVYTMQERYKNNIYGSE